MLTLILKKRWFDMIASGAKTEEYREISPYYTKRFETVWGKGLEAGQILCPIAFRNGYAKDAPCFTANCTIDIGEGKPEWGAVPGVKYYRLKIVKMNNGR